LSKTRDVLLRLVHGLVRDDEGLEAVSGIVNGLDELGRQDGVGHLGVLAHDGGPDGELGVVAGGGQGEVVAVVAHALHHVLVDDGEDEAVEGAVGDLLGVALAKSRGNRRLAAVKGVRSGFHALGGGGHALEEQAEHLLAKVHERVVALGEGELEVDKGHVLATRGICRVRIGRLFAQHVGRVRGLVARLFRRLGEAGRRDVVGRGLGA
jgi:hypothetical protein